MTDDVDEPEDVRDLLDDDEWEAIEAAPGDHGAPPRSLTKKHRAVLAAVFALTAAVLGSWAYGWHAGVALLLTAHAAYSIGRSNAGD